MKYANNYYVSDLNGRKHARAVSGVLTTAAAAGLRRGKEIDFISPARKLNTWMLIVKWSIEKAESLSSVVNKYH